VRRGVRIQRRAAARRPVEAAALGEDGWEGILEEEALARARGGELPSPSGGLALGRMLTGLRERLTEAQVEVVALRLGGMTWREIGARTDRTRDAARKLFQRALKAVRERDSASS